MFSLVHANSVTSHHLTAKTVYKPGTNIFWAHQQRLLA